MAGESAICSNGLYYAYGRISILRDLNLQIPAGVVSGFLGPNGAGKTTTIRILLGLLPVERGNCHVLGLPPGHVQALSRIGAMVEWPSLYDHLTGLENLEITRLLRNEPRSEVDRVIHVVGLAKDGHKPVRAYSLGMRQRLGLALALIGNPKLLILDEPMNGLDPSGIHEMRALIRDLPRQSGVTVFLSSHLLSEVEQMASHLVVIHKGQLRYQGALSDFGGDLRPKFMYKTSDPEKTMKLMAQKGLSATLDGLYVEVQAEAVSSSEVIKSLVLSGIDVFEVVPQMHSLESRFLEMIQDEPSNITTATC